MTRMLFALALGVTLSFARPARADGPTTTECIAANELALKRVQEHKLRSAHEALLVCAKSSCPGDIRDECAHRGAEISNAVPTIVFEVKTADGHELADVKISMDGETLATHLNGTALPVDPGEHTFRFEADAHPTQELRLLIHEGEKARVERVSLGSRAQPVVSSSSRPVSPTLPSHPAQEAPSQELGAPRIAALVVGGVGLVGLGIGTYFGFSAGSIWHQAQSDCTTACGVGSTAQRERSDAGTAATISTVAFVSALAMLTTAVVVWLTAPKRSSRVGESAFFALGTF